MKAGLGRVGHIGHIHRHAHTFCRRAKRDMIRTAMQVRLSKNIKIICLIIGALIGSPAQASAPDMLGFGVRALGLSGAVVSGPKGAEAVYHNPAGLGFETQRRFSLGYQFTQLNLSINNQSLDVPNGSATSIGVVLPLGFGGFLQDRLTVGAGFVIPTNSVLTASLPAPGTAHFPVLGHRLQTVSLMGSLGVRLNDGWSIGGGVIALSALIGAIDVAPNADGRIGSSARNQLIAAYAPILGTLVRWGPTDSLWSMGLVYRGESLARFDLPVTANLGDDSPLPVPALNIAGTAQYDPGQIEAEMSYVMNGWRFTGGVAWNQWSRFPQPIEYAVQPEGVADLPPTSFSDSWEASMGLEWSRKHDTRPLSARAGYRWLQTPTEEQEGFHSFLDSHRHVLSCGGYFGWGGFGIGFGAQYQFAQDRHHEKRTGPLSGTQLQQESGLWSMGIELEVHN